MSLFLWSTWSEVWTLYQSVTFDGENKHIIINPGVTNISIKVDVYSAWKEWVLTLDNAKYEAALRVIGGDPVGDGLFAGDIYFLRNGWQIVVNDRVRVEGILFHDDSIDTYIVGPGGGVVSTVSNLVQTSTDIPDGISQSLTSIDSKADTTITSLGTIQQDIVALDTKVDTNELSLTEIKNTLTIINDKIDNVECDVDLSGILTDLEEIIKKIDETQAFVLSQ